MTQHDELNQRRADWQRRMYNGTASVIEGTAIATELTRAGRTEAADALTKQISAYSIERARKNASAIEYRTDEITPEKVEALR